MKDKAVKHLIRFGTPFDLLGVAGDGGEREEKKRKKEEKKRTRRASNRRLGRQIVCV